MPLLALPQKIRMGAPIPLARGRRRFGFSRHPSATLKAKPTKLLSCLAGSCAPDSATCTPGNHPNPVGPDNTVGQRKMNHRSYLLDLYSREELRAKSFPQSGIAISQAKPGETDRCRRLWTEVGRGFWSEREEWLEEQWDRHLKDSSVSFWIATRSSEDIGFFELTALADDIKIEGFGLLPPWRTHGFGGGLLSAATQRAFDLGARRVWLHTATDDHPNALPNYKKRGYRIYHEETLESPMPNQSPEPTRSARGSS